MEKPSQSRLAVHVVDDSAVVRQVFSALLQRRNDIDVTVSPDPIIALQKIAKQRPDVIITDLMMPKMDGLTFVRTIMRQDPTPMIVCSSAATPGASAAFAALQEGAVEIITKPHMGVKDFLEVSADALIDLVWEVSRCKIPKRTLSHPQPLASILFRTKSAAKPSSTRDIVAIGASTGGTEAIRYIVEKMRPDCPPMLVVQHMPAVFTRAFAEHLNRDCAINVKEATDGDVPERGTVLIAPGDRHMTLCSGRGRYYVQVAEGPTVSGHCPSVDVLFQSVAKTAGKNALGILMTGMGRDGAQGLLEMRNAGAHTVAQDEASSVVFGMPREAIALRAACDVLSLQRIPARIEAEGLAARK